MPSLIGNKPNQVPSNGDLGTLAFQDANAVNISGGIVDVSAGTAALPTLGTTGDENTGVFFPAADTIGVSTGGTERVRIDSSGNVGIGLTPTSRNNTRLQIVDGIGFPATQVASSDANTLDDYEEGTWTINLNNGYNSAGTTTTYTYNTGYYTKIGRQVTVTFRVVFDVVSGGSGPILISGLPFTPNDTTQYVGNLWMSNVNTNDTVKNLFWGYAVLDNGSYYLVMGGTLDNAGMANANCIARTDIASGDIISGTLTYFV